MNVLTGVGILLLSMLIVAFLQLTPSVLTIFLHYASAKYSRNRVSDLTLFYIFGVEVFVALVFVSIYYIITNSLSVLPDGTIAILDYLLLAIFAIIGVGFPFLYFRKGEGTRLFISRKLAKNLTNSVKKIKTRSDAFCLGLTAGLPELPLTAPIYILSASIIAEFSEVAIARAAMILLFMIVATIPLFVIRILFAHHHNLANIQMFREKNKKFYSTVVGIMYILIAVMILLRIIN